MGRLRRWEESSQTPNRVILCLNSDVLTSSHTDHTDRAKAGTTGSEHSYHLLQAQLLTGLTHTLTLQLNP